MPTLGEKIRRSRRRLAMSLDDLASRSGISKAYLSLIETGRVVNPPSDEKLMRIEESLGFSPGELVGRANLQRTPRDIRAVLHRLIQQGRPDRMGDASSIAGPVDLDSAYLTGVLQTLAEQASGGVSNIEPLSLGGGQSVPIINKVSAGYPSDFTDLGYPPRVADQQMHCPDIADPDAFAARVSGDSMMGKYAEGDIVVFSPAAVWKDGADCFVRFDDGQTTFKRVFVEKDEAGGEMLRLQPRNDRYPPRVVPREHIAGLYKAVYCYRSVEE